MGKEGLGSRLNRAMYMCTLADFVNSESFKEYFLKRFSLCYQRRRRPAQPGSVVERRQMSLYSGAGASMSKILSTVHEHELGRAAL